MSIFYDGVAEIFEVDAVQISPDFALESEEMAWDSLGIVSMIALIDECFDVMIDSADLANCESLGDIEKLIKKAKRG